VAHKQVYVAPSLLAADFTRLGEQVREAEAHGVSILHLDVMDGRFVPNITMGPLVVEAVRRATQVTLDVHLMIVEPERYVQAFADAGADIISVHLEASPHLHRTLEIIHQAGCKAGVAINPHTSAESLRDVMGMVDLVNVMTVNPGFGGQSFIYSMMPKIARLRAMAGDIQREIDIEVDGGINAKTAQAAVQAGANILVAGTAVFNHPQGISGGLAELYSALTGEQEDE
jgi:ribulose-phosphate 3-epimerase